MRPFGRKLQLIGLLVALALSAAGCFRPAGDAIEPTAGGSAVDGGANPAANPTTLPPTDLPADGGASDTAPTMNPQDTTATVNAMLAQITPTVGGTIDVLLDTPGAIITEPPTEIPPLDATATPQMEVLTIETIVAETQAAGGDVGGAGNPSPTPLPVLPDNSGSDAGANALTPQIITATAVYITPNAPQAPVIVPTSTPLPTDASSGSSSDGGAGSSDGTSDEGQPGSIETSPDGCFYIVESGDSLYAIALANGISLDDLREANSDVDPQSLQIGQRLRLPTCDLQPPTATTSALIPGADATEMGSEDATGVPSPTPITEGVSYTVQAGDTVVAIASRFGVTVNAIVRANAALQANPNLLRIGQELIIPVPVTPTSPPATPTRSVTLPANSPIEPVMATPTVGG